MLDRRAQPLLKEILGAANGHRGEVGLADQECWNTCEDLVLCSLHA
jgi:hypothetical protein